MSLEDRIRRESEALRRSASRVRPPEPERLHARAGRRRAAQLATATLVLAVFAGGALALGVRLGLPDERVRPAGPDASTIDVGGRPRAVAADGRSAWVVDAAGRLTMLDAGTGRIRDRVDLDVEPGAEPVALIRSGGRLYLQLASQLRADAPRGTVLVLDPSTGEVLRRLPLPGPGRGGIAVARDRVWYADFARAQLAGIPLDGAAAVTSPSGVPFPNSVALGFGSVWVVGDIGDPDFEGRVGRFDPATRQTTTIIPVGRAPVAIAAGEGSVWVANRADGTVSRIDPRTAAVVATIDVGGNPVAVAAGGGSVWVANRADGTVSRIDAPTGRVVATVTVGSSPGAVAVGGATVWVANELGGTVSRISP